MQESCCSMHGFSGPVTRAQAVHVKGRNEVGTVNPHKLKQINQEGEEVSWKSSGWEARILQHEVDHLHGKMFIDKVMPIVKEALVIMFFSLIFLCNNSAFYPHN